MRAAEFITAVFLDAAASPGPEHEGSPRALLAEADRLGAIRFGDGSEMRAFVRHRVGCEYLDRWMAGDAEAYLRAAAAYFEERYGPADPQSAESSYRLGLALQAQGARGTPNHTSAGRPTARRAPSAAITATHSSTAGPWQTRSSTAGASSRQDRCCWKRFRRGSTS